MAKLPKVSRQHIHIVIVGRRWMEVKIVRLVDLDAVIDHLEVEWGYEGIREDLYSLPVVDAVPVVRCKDCINYIGGTCWRCGLDYSVIVDADDFCSRGVPE